MRSVALEAAGHSHMIKAQKAASSKGNVDTAAATIVRHPTAEVFHSVAVDQS